MLTAGLDPMGPFPGTDEPWPSLHLVCGLAVSPTYSNVKRGQGGCVACGLRKLSQRFRMDEGLARERFAKVELEPLGPYPGSSVPWRARHLLCGREVSPTLSNITAGRGVCRYCFSDFPYAGPAQVYLVSDGRADKIGICSPGSGRLRVHELRGWRVCWVVDVASGDDAYSAEQAVIRWWREGLGQPPAYRADEMPQQGATETIRTGVVSTQQTRDLVVSWLARADAVPNRQLSPPDAPC